MYFVQVILRMLRMNLLHNPMENCLSHIWLITITPRACQNLQTCLCPFGSLTFLGLPLSPLRNTWKRVMKLYHFSVLLLPKVGYVSGYRSSSSHAKFDRSPNCHCLVMTALLQKFWKLIFKFLRDMLCIRYFLQLSVNLI